MKEGFRSLFSFNKKERNGIVILLAIFLCLILTDLLLPYMAPAGKYDFGRFARQVDSFQVVMRQLEEEKRNEKKNTEYSAASYSGHSVENEPPVKLFRFNPNDLSREKWKKLGLKSWQVDIIKNYEAGGGAFRVRSDLKKIYGLSEEKFRQLKPYVDLPDKRFHKDHSGMSSRTNTEEYDLNESSDSLLQNIPGIGRVYSARIIKYRSLLGGFVSEEQAMEVYGIDSNLYNQIKDRIFVDSGFQPAGKININAVGVEELSKHPYIEQHIARAIVNYRKQHGDYNKLSEMKNIVLIEDELFQKITPYLKTK